jgi:hypothetical protein
MMMKNKSKMRLFGFAVFITAMVFSLAACPNSLQGKGGGGVGGSTVGDGSGSLTVSVGSMSISRNIIDPKTLSHEITVKDSSGKVHCATIGPDKTTTTISSLALGWCTVEVKGWLNKNEVSKNKDPIRVNIIAGSNGPISIIMKVKDGSEYGGGGDDPTYTFPADLTTIAAKLKWLETNATDKGIYIIEATADEDIAPQTLSYGERIIGITLIGEKGKNITVSLLSNGSMFTVGSNVKLILENITLKGQTSNTSALVVVEGELVMNEGSLITGNNDNNGNGGGVYVREEATFTMSDGTISGNKAVSGGGVFVGTTGTFTMGGGTITENEATTAGSGGGGGVYTVGTFTMKDGTISGNNVVANGFGGGGVFVGAGAFTMSGGTIGGETANTAANGGGVYVYEGGEFIMNDSDSKISGNEATNGGGVFVGGEFTMNGSGQISGNTATTNGGGVYVSEYSTFTMNGGEIKSNKAQYVDTGNGGGVYVGNIGTFHISDGTIYGMNDGPDSNSVGELGAALFTDGGTAQHGTGTTWTDFNNNGIISQKIVVSGGVAINQ